MESRLERLEHQVRELGTQVHTLENRLTELERDRPSEPAPDWEPPEWLQSAPADAGRRISSSVPLVGRSLLILGGAFLLRAVTDLEAVPDVLGLGLGFSYALLWILLADRTARSDDGRLPAAFYSVVGIGIALPLVQEAATRFLILGPVGVAVALGVVGAAGLVVAARRDLLATAVAAVLGVGLAALVLLRSFEQPAAPLTLLLVLYLVTLWLSYRKEWRLVPWLGALPADLGFAVAAGGIAAGRFTIAPGLAMILLLALFAGTLAIVSRRTLRQGQHVGTFEVAQTVLAGFVGLGGALRISELSDLGAAVPGSTALALGIASYGIAFSRAIRADRRRNFFFYTTLGLALVAVGSLAFLELAPAALVWSALGLVCSWSSGRFNRVTLSLHGTIYLLAAMFASGLARAATDAFWRSDPADWLPVETVHWAVIAAMAACVAIPAARTSRSWGKLAKVPRAALLLFTIWAAGGALLGATAPRLFGSGGDLDAGALAASRTAIFAVAAVLLAWIARSPRFSEAAWLVYPLLVVAGIRVLAQDLPQGRPVTLFVSVGLLGASLLIAYRWLRPEQTAPDPE
jgi:hypothetical protein